MKIISGTTLLGRSMDEALNMLLGDVPRRTLSALRAQTAPPDRTYYVIELGALFLANGNDTDSPDNGTTILVDGIGTRFNRITVFQLATENPSGYESPS